MILNAGLLKWSNGKTGAADPGSGDGSDGGTATRSDPTACVVARAFHIEARDGGLAWSAVLAPFFFAIVLVLDRQATNERRI
jgi:hypothetical protein